MQLQPIICIISILIRHDKQASTFIQRFQNKKLYIECIFNLMFILNLMLQNDLMDWQFLLKMKKHLWNHVNRKKLNQKQDS